eukprot:EC721066.1.p1 GENE.EC721066.1~~EC721066.1.p1  ORF type:complete len:122 (+),score=14.02 EC721066.1:41-406(+)
MSIVEEDERLSLWETISSTAGKIRDTIIPDSVRYRVKNATKKIISYGGTGVQYAGKAAWVLSTAALVLVLPLAMEVDREQALVDMEQEAMRQQGGAPAGYGLPSMPGGSPLPGMPGMPAAM